MSCWESFLLCRYGQGFPPFSTIRLIESGFIVKSLIQLGHKFCAGCWVWIYFHSYSQRHPVVLASFVEDLIFFPVWISGFFIKNTCCKGLAFSSSGTEVEPQSQRSVPSINLSIWGRETIFWGWQEGQTYIFELVTMRNPYI